MRQQTFRFGFVCIIMAVMIIANIDVQSTKASPGDAWVKNGMTFTYVVDSFSFGNITEPTTVAWLGARTSTTKSRLSDWCAT